MKELTYDQAKRMAESKACLRHPDKVPVVDIVGGEYRPGCAGCRREGRQPVWGEYSAGLERSGQVATQALATRELRLAALAVQDVRSLIPGLEKCSEREVKGFILYCKAVNADPWAKEIYLVKYDEKSVAAIVLALNWYLKRASHNPAYESYASGVIVERQGQYLDLVGSVVYPGDKLFGGWCRVYKKGAQQPFERRVSMQEYDRHQFGWVKMPATMIEKVAIVQGVRRAFPDEFGEEPEIGMPVVLEGEVETEAAPQPAAPLLSEAPASCPAHLGQAFRLVRGRWMHAIEGETGPRGGSRWCYQDETVAQDMGQAQEGGHDTQPPLEDPQEGTWNRPQHPSEAEVVPQDPEAPRTPRFAHLGDVFTWALRQYGLKSVQVANAAGYGSVQDLIDAVGKGGEALDHVAAQVEALYS